MIEFIDETNEIELSGEGLRKVDEICKMTGMTRQEVVHEVFVAVILKHEVEAFIEKRYKELKGENA